MLLKKYITFEVLKNFFIIFFILLFVLLCKSLLAHLGSADSFLVQPLLLPLVFYSTPAVLILIIPFSFLLSVVVSLNKMYDNREMLAAKAIGMTNSQLYYLLFRISVLLAFIMFFVSFQLEPSCRAKQRQLLEQAHMQQQIEDLPVNKFFKINNMVVYIKQLTNSLQPQNIFMVSEHVQDNKNYTNLVLAKSVDIKQADDAAVVNLHDGVSYVLADLQRELNVIGFGDYQISLPYRKSGLGSVKEYFATKLIAMNSAVSQALLYWRASLVVFILILSVIGFAVAKTEVSAGSMSIVLAVGVYVAYILSLLVGKRLIEQGVVNYITLFGSIHLFFLCGALGAIRARYKL